MRELYYKDYQMQSGTLRLDYQKYKIYLSSRSPQIIRRSQMGYKILQSDYNFNLTFLQNLDYMGKQFSWNNRKSIGISFRQIFQLQKLSISHPITITKVYKSQYNNQQFKNIRELKIERITDSNNVKITFMITSQTSTEQDKWTGVYEISINDFQFLLQSAKKNIYYSSGLKTTIQLQKRQIIRKMDKRAVKNLKILSSQISNDIDINENDLKLDSPLKQKISQKGKEKMNQNQRVQKLRVQQKSEATKMLPQSDKNRPLLPQ